MADDMLDGYLDGLDDDREHFPESLSNRSLQYRHGWENGRDDRMHRPRATAKELRDKARKLKEGNL